MDSIVETADKKLNLIYSRRLSGMPLERVVSTLFESLIELYVAGNKGRDNQWFYEEIYNPCDVIVKYPEGIVSEKLLNILNKIDLPEPILQDYKFSLMSCFVANGYIYQKNREMAWASAADAACILGSLFGTANVRRNYKEMDESIKSDRAREGGIKRSDKYSAHKEIVYKIAKDQCPPSGKWKSVNNMSILIAEKLLKEIAERKLETKLSIQNAPRLVAEWLKQMPGIEELVNLRNRGEATSQD